MDSTAQPATPSHGDYLSRRYFGSLDGLRAICILAVVWHHAVPLGSFTLPMSNRGFLGVDMFFVISGFLIVTLLLRERARTGAISLKKFYIRRTLRIFPIYYALLAALSALYLLKTDARTAEMYWGELPYYLTYTSNWILGGILPFTWSLAAEEQFYLLWPPVERALKKLVFPLLFLIIGLSQAVNFGLLDAQLEAWIGPHATDLMIVHATFAPICFGVLLAHALHHPIGFARVARLLCHRAAAPLAGIVVLVCVNLPHEDISGWPRLAIQLSLTALLATLVMREDHALRRLFHIPFFKRIGVISYGMYLYHLFLSMAAEKVVHKLPEAIQTPVLTFLLATAATIVVAELSFRLFETPILRYKNRFSA